MCLGSRSTFCTKKFCKLVRKVYNTEVESIREAGLQVFGVNKLDS